MLAARLSIQAQELDFRRDPPALPQVAPAGLMIEQQQRIPLHLPGCQRSAISGEASPCAAAGVEAR